jgi:glucose-1-phosphate cytidylyltransferase
MKVVLFCGGMGTRLRDYSDSVPKPMVTVGSQPVLWHVMKYYAHFGHNDFILCLGYRGDSIREYFRTVGERGDTEGWRITFAETGQEASIGERLKAVEPLLEGEEIFLANYSDGLTDLPLPGYIDFFTAQEKVASFLCVKSMQTFHVVSVGDDAVVSRVEPLRDSAVRINGGYFLFRKEIFRYLDPGQDLVEEPFRRLISGRQLIAYTYGGFWAAMDTFKDRQWLADLFERGEAPWELWRPRSAPSVASAVR